MRFPEGEYFPTARKKTGIAIHHTVGGSALSTFNYWLKDRTRTGKRRVVGTAYIIDRSGTIHQVFDPSAWAFQFGIKWSPARQMKFEQRFIGIELASEGGLTDFEGDLYSFDRISPKTRKRRDEAFDYGKPYRGYRYFDKYEMKQVDSLIYLINHLCERFSIPRKVPFPPFDFYGDRIENFKGIIGHAMVRADKTDPAPSEYFWDRLFDGCRLTLVPIESNDKGGSPVPGSKERESLFAANLGEVMRLSVGAGSLVKGLLMELERRGVFIRLVGADPGGRRVAYEVVAGNKDLIRRLAAAMGFQRRSDQVLQVNHG